jgi:UDP-N-acetylglucosamine--N-acetylmuramyl-(pentapeptide) pyrophosphoryl-undecaprenol N-acetylglucosamine transferase
VAVRSASLPAALRLIRRRRPQVVLSVGGYAAGPIALAARASGVPVTLLEPNSVLGLTNRLLAPLVVRAYTMFGEVERSLRPGLVRREGVPLRRDFARVPYEPAAGRFRVLVLGGSLGAAGINAVMPDAFRILRQRVPFAKLLHQTGRDRDLEVRARYGGADLADGSVRVEPFVDDVAAALAEADVVVQRAGASSLAELCAVGRPSLLIPFPHAADQHQLKNARALESAGASIALPQVDATPERLAGELAALAEDRSRRVRMAERAAEQGRPGAAARVASDLLDLAGAGAGRGEVS